MDWTSSLSQRINIELLSKEICQLREVWSPAKSFSLFDAVNILLDSGRVTADLRHHLEKEVDREGAQCYRNIFEQRGFYVS